MRIYLLSDYSEYGSENVRATADKRKLLAMLVEMGYGQPECLAKLQQLLEEDGVHFDGVNLGHGWGGAQLHVIELE